MEGETNWGATSKVRDQDRNSKKIPEKVPFRPEMRTVRPETPIFRLKRYLFSVQNFYYDSASENGAAWSGETSGGGLPNRWPAPRVREGGVGSVGALQHVVEVDLVPVTEHEDGHVTALRDLAQQLLLQHVVLLSGKGRAVTRKQEEISRKFPWNSVTRWVFSLIKTVLLEWALMVLTIFAVFFEESSK